jgi:hypothetical protein
MPIIFSRATFDRSSCARNAIRHAPHSPRPCPRTRPGACSVGRTHGQHGSVCLPGMPALRGVVACACVGELRRKDGWLRASSRSTSAAAASTVDCLRSCGANRSATSAEGAHMPTRHSRRRAIGALRCGRGPKINSGQPQSPCAVVPRRPSRPAAPTVTRALRVCSRARCREAGTTRRLRGTTTGGALPGAASFRATGRRSTRGHGAVRHHGGAATAVAGCGPPARSGTAPTT